MTLQMDPPHSADATSSPSAFLRYDVSLHDHPVALPEPRGPVSAALISMLQRSPDEAVVGSSLTWRGDVGDAALDDDLQLALWLSYELHYRGLAGVSDEWEWQPDLVRSRNGWEGLLLKGLAAAVGTPASLREPDAGSVVNRLTAIAGSDAGPSLSRILMRDADIDQFQEFLIHRSIYHLKEADAHTWAIPRLSGPVKAALVTIQADEYGSGRTAAMHAQLFRGLLASWQLQTAYGHYLGAVPAVTLLANNIMSMFGIHRRWRGALVGHLTLFEMTSSVPNARYARAHRRLGGSEAGARFFDEHVLADAAHEQIAAYELAGGLVAAEPQLAGDVVFGALCAQYADEQFAVHLTRSWSSQQSSLRTGATR